MEQDTLEIKYAFYNKMNGAWSSFFREKVAATEALENVVGNLAKKHGIRNLCSNWSNRVGGFQHKETEVKNTPFVDGCVLEIFHEEPVEYISFHMLKDLYEST